MTDTAPDTGTPETATPDQAPDTPDTGTDWAAEAEKWKAQARKHEERAKANATAAKDLEALRQQTMSDTDKAIEIARTEARAEVLREIGGQVVDAEVRAAVAGRPIDVDALLDGLDRSRFIDAEGQPDRDAIASWVDRIAPRPANGYPADLGQGARGNPGGPNDPLLDGITKALRLK